MFSLSAGLAHTQHSIKSVCWRGARNPHPWEEKQKDQKFKVVLGCVVNLRLAWATEVTVSKQN